MTYDVAVVSLLCGMVCFGVGVWCGGCWGSSTCPPPSMDALRLVDDLAEANQGLRQMAVQLDEARQGRQLAIESLAKRTSECVALRHQLARAERKIEHMAGRGIPIETEEGR